MIWGFIILIALFMGYAAFTAAIIWHLKVYAFSRSAKWMVRLFVALALLLAVSSLVFFSVINWDKIFALYA